MFSHLLGNPTAKEYLARSLDRGTLPRTLLFQGPDGVGKGLFAEIVAKALIGRPPYVDLHILKPEGKVGLYPIESLRALIDSAHLPPYEGRAKVFILHDVERMAAPSANALLKTLEEPTASSYFILLSSHPDELLPTLLSRCCVVRFDPIPLDAIRSKFPKEAALAGGSMARASALARDPALDATRKNLFSLLRDPPPYPHLLAACEAIAAASPEEGIEAQRYAESLLVHFLMWHRDQEAHRVGACPLLFPEEGRVERALPPLASILKKVADARDALQRNIPLGTVLKALIPLVI